MIWRCEVARPKPWEVDEGPWAVIAPLLPEIQRRTRYPARRRHPNPLVFRGIPFVPHTGISWEHLPQELGFDSGTTFWRRPTNPPRISQRCQWQPRSRDPV
ncbi:transposase [Kitasatospora sp. NPDC094019]|uniref:transposase n=1 Tax=Kitasatospora sp. NPDC094019 TaxID=3364091 RepID=UPI00380FE47A